MTPLGRVDGAMVALFRCRPTVRCRVRLLSWLVPPCADRELAARSDAYRKTTAHGQLRVRVRSEQIAAAGVERVPKVELLGGGAGYAPAALLPGAIRPVEPPSTRSR